MTCSKIQATKNCFDFFCKLMVTDLRQKRGVDIPPRIILSSVVCVGEDGEDGGDADGDALLHRLALHCGH